MVADLIYDRIDISRADGTMETYATGLNSYLKICAENQIRPYPVSEAKLVAYASLAHETHGILAETIRNYISGVVFHCKLNGIRDPRGDGSMLSLVLRGSKRLDHESGYEKRTRFGISGKQLALLFSKLDLSDFRAARFAAYASISYFGGFRANELVKTKAGIRCKWGDFNLREGARDKSYFTLKQRDSKTKQFGPTYDITLVRTGKINCPFELLQNYRRFFDKDSIDENGPAFMDLEGHPYTFKAALKDVRFYLPFIGENGMHFGTHSFRIGLATEASIIELPDSAVKLLGRWDSNCFEIYMLTPPEKIAEFAARLSGV
jgi:hypothetical protein